MLTSLKTKMNPVICSGTMLKTTRVWTIWEISKKKKIVSILIVKINYKQIMKQHNFDLPQSFHEGMSGGRGAWNRLIFAWPIRVVVTGPLILDCHIHRLPRRTHKFQDWHSPWRMVAWLNYHRKWAQHHGIVVAHHRWPSGCSVVTLLFSTCTDHQHAWSAPSHVEDQ